MIVVDGSFGEGGGQLLRYSVALAAIMGEEVKVINIRAKRSNPGLRPQHLNAIKTIASLVGAEVEGLRIGSTQITFRPKRRPRGGQYKVDIGTAGSISLLLQATLPVLVAADSPVELTVRGGTTVKWSPPVPYMQHVLLPLLKKFGVKAEIDLIRRGFYPEGGGIVKVRVKPGKLRPISISPYKEIKSIRGISYVGNLPRHIAVRQASSARSVLEKRGYGRYIEEIVIDDKTPAASRGTGIVVWAETDQGVAGGDSLGERGKRAEVVGREAGEKLADVLDVKASTDDHALDNLVIYMALTSGTSEVYAPRMTSHAETALWLCKKITGASYEVEKRDGGIVVRIRGAGLL